MTDSERREKIQDITVEELQAALGQVDGKKPTQRLIVALNYKKGISPAEMAEWYDVSTRTIYNWLDRFESKSLDQAIYDCSHSDRASRLSSDEREQLEETLRLSPTDVGFGSSTWTPELVQKYIDTAFDVDFTRRHVRRLMRDIGLTPHSKTTPNRRPETSYPSSGWVLSERLEHGAAD